MNKQLQIRIGELLGKDYFALEFGCVFMVFDSKRIVVDVEGDDIRNLGGDIVFTNNIHKIKESKNIEILGTEPTLQDVLLAVDNLPGSNCSLNVHTKIVKIWTSKEELNYDLTLSLFNQTDETKQHLLELMS